MPVATRKLIKEIEQAGCSIKRTSKGHYLVLDSDGNPICGFAAMHPGKEVLDLYVRKARAAIARSKKP